MVWSRIGDGDFTLEVLEWAMFLSNVLASYLCLFQATASTFLQIFSVSAIRTGLLNVLCSQAGADACHSLT